jgi:PhoH-like ATPase
MEKTYILDTSTIISDPKCISSFPDSKIIIHISVLNELDKLKTFTTEAGKSARVFVRRLDEMSKSGNINEGLKAKNGAIIIIDTKEYDAAKFGDPSYGDNRMLACAVARKDENPTVITQDIGFRIKARALGVSANSHNKHNYTTDDLHSGFTKIQNEKYGKIIRSGRSIELKSYPALQSLKPNECVSFTDENNEIISLAKKNCKFVNPINKTNPWSLKTRNIQQAFAVDLLLDPAVPLVTLSGMAGTGKTLVAVACGLEQVINRKRYNEFLIYRPIQSVGADIGYLPGTLEEKLEPWMAAVSDSLDFLVKDTGKDKQGKRAHGWRNKLAHYADKISMEALTHIRGRSISNAFILLDECQNITKDEIKTILTRVGENTKIVLTGDIEQIDNNKLDALDNGLTYVVEAFKGSELAGHISLVKGERSPLATEAAKIL